MTITLESEDADTFLYLREGEARSGDHLHQNDDHEGSRDVSHIQETLAAGTYTVEATTYGEGETSSFTLTVSGQGTSAPTPSPSAQPLYTIRDEFGPFAGAQGITLVDWEGYMANPALQHSLSAPEGFAFPVKVTLRSSEPRIYFNMPTGTGLSGPVKELLIRDASHQPEFLMSIFPDRDTEDERHELSVTFEDPHGETRTTSIDVFVDDQDLNRPLDFRIHVDFAQDTTGLFDEEARETVRQVADDVAYFMAARYLDEVPAGSERTFIWSPKGYHDTGGHRIVTNRESYRGFLLYAYGMEDPDEIRAGGEGSTRGGFQKYESPDGSLIYPLRRSGGVQFSVFGNQNTLGWSTGLNTHGGRRQIWRTSQTTCTRLPCTRCSTLCHSTRRTRCLSISRRRAGWMMARCPVTTKPPFPSTSTTTCLVR